MAINASQGPILQLAAALQHTTSKAAGQEACDTKSINNKLEKGTRFLGQGAPEDFPLKGEAQFFRSLSISSNKNNNVLQNWEESDLHDYPAWCFVQQY